ncbi:MAG: cell division protein FtsQ/DivIB [Candidatus Paceibacterota bacterium]
MKIFFKGLIIAGLILGLGFLLIQKLSVKQVRCFLNNQEIGTEQRICQQLQQLTGTPLLFRDFQHDSKVASLLYIQETKEVFVLERIEKSLIGEVTIFLSNQPPLYRIEQSSAIYLVTAGGHFQENNNQLSVPLVIDANGIYQQDPEKMHYFLTEFLKQLDGQLERIKKITLVSPQRIELQASDFPIMIVELSQEPQQVARRLKLLLQKLVPAQIDVALQEIDLRFELPVLRTYQSSDSGQVLIDS